MSSFTIFIIGIQGLSTKYHMLLSLYRYETSMTLRKVFKDTECSRYAENVEKYMNIS